MCVSCGPGDGENLLSTHGYPSVRVGSVRGKSGPVYVYNHFFSPDIQTVSTT